jgi:hypothetical protein
LTRNERGVRGRCRSCSIIKRVSHITVVACTPMDFKLASEKRSYYSSVVGGLELSMRRRRAGCGSVGKISLRCLHLHRVGSCRVLAESRLGFNATISRNNHPNSHRTQHRYGDCKVLKVCGNQSDFAQMQMGVYLRPIPTDFFSRLKIRKSLQILPTTEPSLYYQILLPALSLCKYSHFQ